MKQLAEKQNLRAEKLTRMDELFTNAQTENRKMADDEGKEYNSLKKDVETLDEEIRTLEEHQNFINKRAGIKNPTRRKDDFETEKKKYSISKAIREHTAEVLGKGHGLEGREREIQQEFENRGIETQGIILPFEVRANENTPTTHADIIGNEISPYLSVIGKEPLHKKMGVKIYPGLTSPLTLNMKTATQGSKTAIGTDLSNDSNDPDGATLTPERFGVTDIWGLDLIKSANDKLMAAILADMLKGCERAITAEVYTVALAGATAVAAGALSQAGFNALMAAVDGEGAFAMDVASFFATKVVALDAGSGIFLGKHFEHNRGKSFEGVDMWYSNLFADGTDKQYVLYGDWHEAIAVGEWDGVELIIDPYTLKKAGRVETTMNKIADVVCVNDEALVVSPDLDAS